jgi:hypothetical protein
MPGVYVERVLSERALSHFSVTGPKTVESKLFVTNRKTVVSFD